MQHAFKFEDQEINVALSRAKSGYRLHVGDRVLPVQLHREDDDTHVLTVAGHSEPLLLAVRGDAVHIHLDGTTYLLSYRDPLDRLAERLHGAAEDHLQAPMPGNIVAIHVAAGDAVSRGQALLIMESMKMETTIIASRDGVVACIHFEKGQSFERDALLLSLVPAVAS